VFDRGARPDPNASDPSDDAREPGTARTLCGSMPANGSSTVSVSSVVVFSSLSPVAFHDNAPETPPGHHQQRI
jgi:hypothetical protein